MQLSKLLDAERDWFNRKYLDGLNAFSRGKGGNEFPSHFAPGYHVTITRNQSTLPLISEVLKWTT